MLYQGIKNKISIEDLLNSATSSTSQAQSTANSLMNIVMQFRKVGISIEDFFNSASSSTSQAQSTANSLMNIVMQFRKVRWRQKSLY